MINRVFSKVVSSPKHKGLNDNSFSIYHLSDRDTFKKFKEIFIFGNFYCIKNHFYNNIWYFKFKIAEIMQKIREQLGNLNATDIEDADIMKWGFQNLKKMGKVALALTRKELEKFPLTGIESSLDIIGKHNGWARRKVSYFNL